MSQKLTIRNQDIIVQKGKDVEMGAFKSKDLKDVLGVLLYNQAREKNIYYSIDDNLVLGEGGNAAVPLNIVTPLAENQNQPIHPKVLFLPNKFGGHYFWMAYTPYPNQNDGLENPCIACSDNLYDWHTPDGLTNPLDSETWYDAEQYNSDTHLLYRDDLNVLECWFRYCDELEPSETIYRMTSKDGVHWTEKELMFKNNGTGTYPYAHILSPCILWDKEARLYRIWAIDKNISFKAIYYDTPDGKNWANRQETNLVGWHFDVIRTELGYESVVSDTSIATTISYSTSSDGIVWSAKEVILGLGESGQWDDNRLYRPSLVKELGKYYLFYTGVHKPDSSHTVWKIGLSVANDGDITHIRGYVSGTAEMSCPIIEDYF